MKYLLSILWMCSRSKIPSVKIAVGEKCRRSKLCRSKLRRSKDLESKSKASVVKRWSMTIYIEFASRKRWINVIVFGVYINYKTNVFRTHFLLHDVVPGSDEKSWANKLNYTMKYEMTFLEKNYLSAKLTFRQMILFFTEKVFGQMFFSTKWPFSQMTPCWKNFRSNDHLLK
jgi:hypothetical protein